MGFIRLNFKNPWCTSRHCRVQTLGPRLNSKKLKFQLGSFTVGHQVLMIVELFRYCISDHTVLVSFPVDAPGMMSTSEHGMQLCKIFKHLCTKYAPLYSALKEGEGCACAKGVLELVTCTPSWLGCLLFPCFFLLSFIFFSVHSSCPCLSCFLNLLFCLIACLFFFSSLHSSLFVFLSQGTLVSGENEPLGFVIPSAWLIHSVLSEHRNLPQIF